MNAVANPRNFAVQPLAGVWVCGTCGNTLAGACRSLTAACQIDADLVTDRLERAGATLLAMRIRSPAPGDVQCALPDIVREAVESYGWSDEPIRPAVPDAAAITLMDATWSWLQFISQQQFLIRRLVAVRSLVHPMSGRHIVTWKRLAGIVRADYRAVQVWHAQGISLICEKLKG